MVQRSFLQYPRACNGRSNPINICLHRYFLRREQLDGKVPGFNVEEVVTEGTTPRDPEVQHRGGNLRLVAGARSEIRMAFKHQWYFSYSVSNY